MVTGIFSCQQRLGSARSVLPLCLAVFLLVAGGWSLSGRVMPADSCVAVTPGSSKKVKSARAFKLISLAPSNTELVYSLGLGAKLVGVCNNCDYPLPAKNLAKVGTFTSVSAEKLAGLRPDLVVLVEGQEKLASDLVDKQGINAVILPNSKLEHIGTNLLKLGAFAGAPDKSAVLKAKFEERIKRLREITCAKGVAPVNVFYCVWVQPLLTVGKNSYLNDVIDVCGGKNLAGGLPAAYPHYSLERLLLSSPQFILLPCEAGGANWQYKNIWRDLPAVKNKRFAVLPMAGEDRLSRPTLRLLGGLYWLAVQLHPELKPALKQWWDETRQIFPDLI